LHRSADVRHTRRELLKLTPVLALGAFAVPRLRGPLLSAGVAFSDWVSARTFREAHLAPTYAEADAVPLNRFPYNGYDVLEPDIDFAAWRLEIGGHVTTPGRYALDQIRALPKVRQNTRHCCVEGWDVIGRFAGARLADVLTMVGADPTARFVAVTCADDYYESIEMACALHPQTLLCYEMYDQPIDRGHGAPLRLQIPTKLGYKQAKYLTTMTVTNVLPAAASYWGDQGYSWYGGL
jgi:DMSO/TMAO reductase YedYZ molybdopterin-dependent catalytic subunit